MSTITMEQKEHLVRIAMGALATHSEMSEAGLGRRELHMIAVAVLRAITPEHEKQVRAKAAEEILADVEPFFAARINPDMWEAAYRAARVAQGDASHG